MQNKGIEMRNYDIETEQLHKNNRIKINKLPQQQQEDGDAI